MTTTTRRKRPAGAPKRKQIEAMVQAHIEGLGYQVGVDFWIGGVQLSHTCLDKVVVCTRSDLADQLANDINAEGRLAAASGWEGRGVTIPINNTGY